MAAITHGPRLGDPRSDGFKVWVRASGAASVALLCRLSGTTTWTTLDTQAIDTGKDNTAVLTATGLSSCELYDYRVDVDGVEGTTYTTRTMPVSGRFAVYYTTDAHDGSGTGTSVTAVYTNILAHYNTNFAPIGVPGIIIQAGDLFTSSVTSNQTVLSWGTDNVLPSNAYIDATGAARTLPLLYMWDDWDWAGNNSSKYPRLLPGPIFTDHADALRVYDYYWRNNSGQPAPPSRGFITVVAGVPILVLDGRSQKEPNNRAFFGLDGLYNWESATAATALGPDQLAWAKTQLAEHASKGMVLIVTGTTFKNAIHEQRAPYSGGGIRDSIGIYHILERNELLNEIGKRGGSWRNNVVILSGDDHWSVVWKDVTRENKSPGDSVVPFPVTPPYPSAPTTTPCPFLEFKVQGGDEDSRTAGNSPILFGPGQFFSRDVLTQAPINDIHGAFIVFDITSGSGGTDVTSRVTYIISECSLGTHTPGDTEVDDLGRTGDFWFENGNFDYYTTTSGQTQTYPTENVSPQMFQRAYVDDINGLLVRESKVKRDEDNLLRDVEDIGNRDRDRLLQDWKPRIEEVPYEP